MIDVTADRTGLGLHRRHVEAQPGEDPQVGVVDDTVGGLHGLLVDVEGIGVGHDQLTGPQQPEPGTGLVAELDLDLVHGERQLAVGVDLAADGDGNHFLVGGPEHERATPTLDLHRRQGIAAEQGRPSALLPQLERMEGRKEELLAAGRVQLLADDGLDVVEDPEPERQERVDARGEAADEPTPHQELVADHLGVGRGLSQGADEEAGHAHGRRSYRDRTTAP